MFVHVCQGDIELLKIGQTPDSAYSLCQREALNCDELLDSDEELESEEEAEDYRENNLVTESTALILSTTTVAS